jgi:hypothetical protein
VADEIYAKYDASNRARIAVMYDGQTRHPDADVREEAKQRR